MTAAILATLQEVGGPGSIKLVQVEGADGQGWHNMANSYGAAWELSQMPPPPLDLRIVDANGNEVTAIGIINQNGQTGTIPAGVQFAFTSTPSANASIQPLPFVRLFLRLVSLCTGRVIAVLVMLKTTGACYLSGL